MRKYQYIKYFFFFILCLYINGKVYGQSAQTINPDGGKELTDGLKILVQPSGKLAVYRDNQTQYYQGHVWPDTGAESRCVNLLFRFSRGGTSYSTSDLSMTSCSTTPAVQNGNNWTTSISGYITSPFSGFVFYVTMNFHYTHPNKYFLVDYYIRAPHDTGYTNPETIHLYLDHDAYILGDDGSRGYRVTNDTGEFIGDYRINENSSASKKNPRLNSTHGFKVADSFRSYYSGAYSPRNNKPTAAMLTNTVTSTLIDDGIAVEFTIGPLNKGEIGAKRVMHAYGDAKGEFDNTPVGTPEVPIGISSPVNVNFTASTYIENEGNATQQANAVKITVDGGTLAQEQVCNFTVSGGSAVAGTDYTYVKGFIIPAGNYTTPQTFTLDNITILGNTTCQNNRTFNISIDSELCNDLIQPGAQRNSIYTILDDDKPTVNQPTNQTFCRGVLVPANTFVFSGSEIPNTTYSWTNSNTTIGLSGSGTGNLPAFTTANTTSDPITASITVTPIQGTCHGESKTFTITVYPQVVAGNITGNLFVCAGMIPLPLQGEASTGGSGNLTYQWQSKPESTGSWSDIPGATQQNYTPTSALTGNTLFRRMTTDDHCDEFKYYSNEILIKIVATPTTLYWNPNALDNNWNNPDNWLTALNGSSVGMVPLACTDVFISNVNINSKYPALDNRTQTDVYGEPVCKNITFAYGAELAYQHKLQYEKAFVRYNWGYYNSPTTGQPANSWEGSQKLDRDQWHILAAPLKSMATGDFSLAGYPFTWQSQFNTSSDGSVVVGNFSVPLATNDMPLTSNNNAIAVKITSYQNLSGYRQNNLEGLKGILEFPYFENPVALPHYTAHHYDAIGKKSYFYYFDTKTLKLINSPLGSMKRGDEAYRFIYETSSNEPPASGTYDMQVEVSGSVNEVMVGNPFLANIDALAFYTANSSKINHSEGYKLLSSDDMTWEQMQFSTDNIIPAWQAFIVTLQPGATSLSFPLEASHTRMASVAGETRATDATVLTGNTLYMQLLKGGTKSGDQSELRYNNAIDGNGIRKMILSEGHATPEVFFIDPDKSTAQLVQPFVQGQREIGIGVKSSDTQTRLSLEFLNVPAFNAATGASVVLVDKHLNARQDLSRNPVYPFTQQASGLDNEYVDKNRFVLQLGNGNETGTQEDVEGIQIAYSGGILKVTADENISEVAVYDLHGRLVFIVRSVNKTHFSQSVVLQSNPYLAQVKTVSGKVKVKKIIGS